MPAETLALLLQSYLKEINSYDEVIDANGQIKPHWEKLFSSIEKLGIGELKNRNQEIIRNLRESGVTYNVYEGPEGLNRAWKLDPIPFLIEQKEWDSISKGLQQRAQLLDLMLKDIYGARTLLRENIVPGELIFDNSGFCRPCIDAKLTGDDQLIFYSADMARGPDGRMWVLDNRVQNPSGFGYALENRNVIGRVLPELAEETFVGSLSSFFANNQLAVSRFSKETGETPNVVLLTPGPNNETYFEHAYLSAFLGYTLVQGDDLLVRDGCVWLKSIEGLQKVDVIVRRVDDEWCDPLELREDSRLGIPGLLQAIRMGNVSVINPLGVGVLENNALMAFMGNASKHFLGEDLLLPSVATWWCGQPKELQYVLDHLDKLIIKKANRLRKSRSIYCRTLTQERLEHLKKEIIQSPLEYVAQEEVSFSTTPSFVEDAIEPRFAAMRAFLVRTGTEYHIMQGGLTRSSPHKNRFTFSNQYGGVAKDTWVISDGSETIARERIVLPFAATTKRQTSLPSRSAENLFWIGRYCERTLSVTTFLINTLNAVTEQRNSGNSSKSRHIEILLKALTDLTLTYPGFTDDANRERTNNPYPEILDIITNREKSGSMASTIESLLRSVIAVRERWNFETWRIVDVIENIPKKFKHSANVDSGRIQNQMEKLQSSLITFHGIISETMPRGYGFQLFETGKIIERISSKVSVLRSTLNVKYDNGVESGILENVLLNHYALVHYRSLYKSQIETETVLEMVLLDKTLPYSLLYQLNDLLRSLNNLPDPGQKEGINNAAITAGDALTRVTSADIVRLSTYEPETLNRKELNLFLSELNDLVLSVSDTLTNMYFSHTELQQSLFSSPEYSTAHEI